MLLDARVPGRAAAAARRGRTDQNVLMTTVPL